MTDKQDPDNDVGSLSQKLQSITTADSNLTENETTSNDRTMPTTKAKNVPSTTATQDRRKNKPTAVDDSWIPTDCPGTNLPERIVFVVDTVREPDCTQFETKTGVKYWPLAMIKRVVEIFVHLKLGQQQTHEFALMTLEDESVSWICDFTNNRKSFVSYLEKIEEDVVTEVVRDDYDLAPCFEKIFKNTDLERPDGVATHVNRVILVYARSRAVPRLKGERRYFDILSNDSHSFVDALYVHEPLSDRNECQEIYAQLGSLDTKQTSFILETGRNPAALHTNMAKLLAHPLQRAKQDNAPYSVFSSAGGPHEVQTSV